MSDTPRVDEFDAKTHMLTNADMESVFGLARTLERELNAAAKINAEYWPSTLATRDALAAALAKLEELESVVNSQTATISGMNNALYMRDQRIAELEKMVNAMKRCSNCQHVVTADPCHRCNNRDLWKWKGHNPKYRCTDRDDGCGHCERSEPHEHPDEQQGDECDRMGKKVKCERVK